MHKLKIYGTPNTSAGRCYWTMEELNLKYDRIPLDLRAKEQKSPEYLKLNPNGKVPCLIDGDFVIWESVAINYYLCEKHKPELLGQNLEARALVQQWSIWSMTELQPPTVDLLIQTVFVPEERRDLGHIEKLRQRIPGLLGILDRHLETRKFMVGEEFTLADINVGSVVKTAVAVQIPLTQFTNLSDWYNVLKERPAFQRFLEVSKH